VFGRLPHPNFDWFIRRRDWFNAPVKLAKSDLAFGTYKYNRGNVPDDDDDDNGGDYGDDDDDGGHR